MYIYGAHWVNSAVINIQGPVLLHLQDPVLLTHLPLGNLNEILGTFYFPDNFSDWLLRYLLWTCLRWMSLNLTECHWTLLMAPSHYLNQCWPRSLLPYGITRPQLEQLERLRSEDTPRRLMIYHWIILDPKSKEDKVKVTNFQKIAKIANMWCANMKWIRWVLLKIQSRHNSVHRRTDGQGDTSIPPFQLRWSGGYNELTHLPHWTKWPLYARWHFQTHFHEGKNFVFWFKFHWTLFLRVQSTIF